MKAAVMHKIRDIRIDDIPEPVVQPGNVLIKVRAVGVCGSDVHYYVHGRIGDQVVRGKHILGHEISGEVAALGQGVKDIAVGARVAVEPGVPCGTCEHCRSGRYNICPDIKFMGTPPVNGGYAEYISWPADYTYKLPDSMSFAEGALVETLSVGMYSAGLAGLKDGETIAILGCGPVGIVTMKAALAAGVKRVFMTDLIDARLKFAEKHGGVTAINILKENPVAAIKDYTSGRGVDAVFEASGADDSFNQSIEIARIGGTVVWIGIPESDSVSINEHTARRKELVIKTTRRFKSVYGRCIEAVESGKIVLKDMVSHEFKLQDIQKAFRLVESRSDGVIKAMITF
jgi:L-iditol 2-dehydrogenase